MLGGMPSGWRNNPAAARTIELRHAGGTIRVSDGPRRVGVLVDDVSIDVGAVEVNSHSPAPGFWARNRAAARNCLWKSASAAEVVLEVGGVRRRVTVTAVGARRTSTATTAHVVFERLPRHPEPGRPVRPGR